METLRKDVKHAWRLFRENPLFTVTAASRIDPLDALRYE